MTPASGLFRLSELDRTNFSDFRERIEAIEAEGVCDEPRRYPGYPCWRLPRVRMGRPIALERALAHRRSVRVLGTATPSRRVLSRLLLAAHGITGPHHRGPVPSSGGLQGLELYLVVFESGWLDAGLYHYDRLGHRLSQVGARADRTAWQARVPSMHQFSGGALLWVLVGDAARIERKYGPRAYRFLLLEAGQLMQNLCLLSEGLGLATLPLGGFFEHEVAEQLVLPPTDVVLYLGACGTP